MFSDEKSEQKGEAQRERDGDQCLADGAPAWIGRRWKQRRTAKSTPARVVSQREASWRQVDLKLNLAPMAIQLNLHARAGNFSL